MNNWNKNTKILLTNTHLNENKNVTTLEWLNQNGTKLFSSSDGPLPFSILSWLLPFNLTDRGL